MSNNPPYAVLELTEEDYAFLLKNCDSNITFGLSALSVLTTRESAHEMVDLIEKFKGLKEKLNKAKL